MAPSEIRPGSVDRLAVAAARPMQLVERTARLERLRARAPPCSAPLAGDGVVRQHLVGDREPGFAMHQAARQREQLVLLALQAAAQGADAALDGFVEAVAVDPAATGIDAGFGSRQR